MTEKDVIRLSDAIKLQRFKEKKSQEDCSKILEISIPTYREYENNPNKLNLEQAIILGNYLNWNMLEFFLQDILHNAISEKE